MNRVHRIQQQFRKENIDGLLVTNPINIKYLVGCDDGILFLSRKKAILFMHYMNREQMEKKISGCEIRSGDENPLVLFSKSRELKRMKRLGFESDVVTVSQAKSFKKSIKVKFVPKVGIVEGLRKKKEAIEIKLIKKASKLTVEVLKSILSLLKVGVREIDIAAEIDYNIRKRGGVPAFPPIVASGCNSSMPHAEPSRRRLKKGDLVIIDLGASYRGYASDMTRTLCIGKPNRRQKDIYEIVLEAQKRAVKFARDSISTKELDDAARSLITNRGYGERFIHGLGHGVGLDVHEAPRISSKSKDKIEEGMVLTIEPGIYIPNFGGVRIEDTVLINKDRCQVLTTASKEFMEM